MAKGTVKKAVPKGTKKSNKGMLIISLILLLLVGGGGAGYFVFFMGNNDEMSEDETSLEKLQVESLESAKPEGETIKEAKEENRIEESEMSVTKKGFYIPVSNCLESKCEKEVVRRIKASGFPFFKKKSVEKTTYYEIISSQPLTRELAKNKIDLFIEHNKMLSPPFISEKNNIYRLSFGTFPSKEKAKEIQNYLFEIEGKTNVKFLITPVNERLTVTRIFAGPFNYKSTANKAAERLKAKTDYYIENFTTKP